MIPKSIRLIILFLLTIIMISFPFSTIDAAGPTEERIIPPIKCVMPSPGWLLDSNEATALILKNWEKLGFRVDVKYAPNWVTFSKMIDNPWSIDAFSGSYEERPDRLEPDRMLTEFATEQIGPGMRNFFGYNNSEFMKILQTSREEMDVAKRKRLVMEAQEYIIKDIPSIAMYHRRSLQPANKKKWENMVAGPGMGLFNIFNFTTITPKTRDKNIVISSMDVLRSLNPMLVPSNNFLTFFKFSYDNLVAVGPNSDIIPWAAKGWKIKDNRTVDVNLREGMMFHDGRPVTAEDVKFSFEYCKKYPVPEYKSLVAPIQKVEVIDKLNIRFTLNSPYAPLFMTTFSTIPIMPKHIWEGTIEKEKLSHPDKWTNPRAIGSGPFKLVYIRPGEEVAFEKNPNHFRAPKADGATIIFPADREAEFLMLIKGTIDFTDAKGLNPVRAKEASQLDHIKVFELGGIQTSWMGFNLREGHPTRDYNIRHALAHTIPYTDIINNILQGKGDPGGGFIAPGNKFWHNANIPQREIEGKVHFHQYDMDKARKILRDAGFEWDSQGKICWPRDYKITVLPK